MQNLITMNYKISITLLLLVGMSISTSARENVTVNTNSTTNNSVTPSAGCSPAVAKATLELNNVRAIIEGTGGSMFQDRANSIAAYEIPKQTSASDPKFTSIYAGALWMGGTDVNGQLKIAAVTFRSTGNDFWPGPLSTTTAEIDAATCTSYDKFYGVSRAMVDQFVGWYQTGVDDQLNGTNLQATDYPGYQIPNAILNWPAHGDVSLGQDWHLAPFFDRDGDDFYDPSSGDYPKYDLVGDIDCRETRDVRLFGDTTIWYVFNDKGNSHSETGGPSIGMEIRGQAFAFSTNDEVNNMTFYNYEMINRSSFTLQDTYFGQWVDADLGGSADDFVGCDAERGLGYCYNGDDNDEGSNGVTGYGDNPPAVGVDFFEGPYQDNDGVDNPLSTNVAYALANDGIPYGGLGLGYGDSIIDNERFGMRKFVYYSIGGGNQGDPNSASDYYNYLKGTWINNSPMTYGGTGIGGTVNCDLMFPGDSDPLSWSTQGVTPNPTLWTEVTANNQPGDRRFLESAGPFTLLPGAVNDLTVGIVWAEATSGGALASVEALRLADDKAQALFDNCFKIAKGPDAPFLSFQELENELIIFLDNKKISNNYNEGFYEVDPNIVIPDTLDGVIYTNDDDKDTLRNYAFQGYKLFQLKTGNVAIDEINNNDVSRLVAQVDINDNIGDIINYEEQIFTANDGSNVTLTVPKQKVQAENEGIRHSFRVTEDLFATGDKRLVNHKTYHFIAIAYAHNEFKAYDVNNPLEGGNLLPYKPSTSGAGNTNIRSYSAIPHNPSPENGGTKTNSKYGDTPEITRIEGQGNGGFDLDLTATSEASIVSNNFKNNPTYKRGKGPIFVKVIDPLSVKGGNYKVVFVDSAQTGTLENAYWNLITPSNDVISSTQTIDIENEQIFIDEGLSITIKQVAKPGVNNLLGSGFISATVEYADSTKQWLGGLMDTEDEGDQNWIKSGDANFAVGVTPNPYSDYTDSQGNPIDPNQDFESLLGGTWSPYRFVSYADPNPIFPVHVSDAPGYWSKAVPAGNTLEEANLSRVPSVDIVMTKDKTKWSRCMVLEAGTDVNLTEGNASHLELRNAASVDKFGRKAGDAGYVAADGDLVSTTGMGWFPGYAINVETGERLNMAFAEDSWLISENGRDMLWNPTENLTAGVFNERRWGGKHYVYVFNSDSTTTDTIKRYDNGESVYNIMKLVGTPPLYFGNKKKLIMFKNSCVWAGIPMVAEGRSFLETDAKVKLRVDRPYENMITNVSDTATGGNGGVPVYQFSMNGFEVETGNTIAADSALALINVVPNPYYAFSEYETGQLDTRMKITNLPEECVVSIYNVGGTLMRRFNKSDPKTSLDWDLNNRANIPVAGGVYLIHVEVPEVGERVLKWFAVMRPTDLNGF